MHLACMEVSMESGHHPAQGPIAFLHALHGKQMVTYIILLWRRSTHAMLL